MNYRHIYHAGNFADIVKHLVLLELIESLKSKDKPFAIMDFFAAIGLYNLAAPEALKTQENTRGIGKLYDFYYQNETLAPNLVKLFMAIISRYNSDGLTYYPASPLIAAEAKRPEDKLVLTELHPADYANLKYNMRSFTNIEIHLLDAYLAVKALLPPIFSRGLVLLDPAFETKDEFTKLASAAKLIHKRFSGILMIWYPIISSQKTTEFYHQLKNSGYKELLKIEFASAIELEQVPSKTWSGTTKDSPMHKCGIIIGNPPAIISTLTEVLEYLCRGPYANKATYKIEWV